MVKRFVGGGKPKPKCFQVGLQTVCQSSKGAKKNFNQKKIKSGPSAYKPKKKKKIKFVIKKKAKKELTGREYKKQLGKKIKDMTEAERKKYNRLRMKASRAKKKN